MPTTLKKPVTRRIGDRVVSIEAEGVRVRRFRRRVSILLPWSDLDLLLYAATRKEAFERPAPRGWVPSPGEWVYVRNTGIGRALVLRTVNAVPEMIVRVRLIGGRGAVERQVLLSEVRPHRQDLEEDVEPRMNADE
jgi:hypothetical protein